MTVGLILRVTSDTGIRQLAIFDFQIFFNLLLPPIILNSGYELHQANFFRNIGTILTFAFAGTFLSAVVIGLLLYLYTSLPIEPISMSFVDAISVGATLSATDPVTILAIFNSYKVDPKLYTIIFGESILNDAIAIVIFETAQKYKSEEAAKYGFLAFMKGVGEFLVVFSVSLAIGVLIGIATAIILKFTYIRRYPHIESCLIVLIAYSSYFFSQGCGMSGKKDGTVQAPLTHKLISSQVLCPCCSAESHSNTMPTSTCRDVHNSAPNTFSRCSLSCPRTMFSFILACLSSQTRSLCSSHYSSSSQ